MVQAAPKRMSVVEFLDWDDGSQQRHELVDGHPVAMAPTREAHGALVMNVGAEIRRRLRPPCRVIAEAGTVVDDSNLFVPDLIVSCAEPRPQELPRDPVLIVEVLSPSTRSFDLGAKADAYSIMPTVQEIWLIDSTRRWLRLWQRRGEVWTVTLPIEGSASFESGVLDDGIALDSLYAGTGH
jgi:Uma2 family endonuclease